MAVNKPILVGDHALVRREGHIPGKFPIMKYSGPYQVIRQHNEWSYKLKNLSSGEEIDRIGFIIAGKASNQYNWCINQRY